MLISKNKVFRYLTETVIAILRNLEIAVSQYEVPGQGIDFKTVEITYSTIAIIIPPSKPDRQIQNV